MKKLKFFLLVFTAAAMFACKQKSAESPVKSITIKHTELGRETMFRITCESFDHYFPDAMVKKLDTKAAIDSVIDELYIMKNIDNDNKPDVRAKILITHADHKTDTVCLGASVLKYKGSTYETPQTLLKLIQE